MPNPSAKDRDSGDVDSRRTARCFTSRAPGARASNLWAKSLHDGREYPVTDFEGRRGNLGWDLATDGQNLYFTWGEDLGDIWVMDVAAYRLATHKMQMHP